MSDIGEWAAMDKSHIMLDGLNKIRLESIFKQNRYSTIGAKITNSDSFLLMCLSHNYITNALLQIFQIRCQAEDSHNFGGDRDIKTAFTNNTLRRAAKTHHNVTQCAVVHINNSAPRDTAWVNIKLITPLHVIIQHCRNQRVS